MVKKSALILFIGLVSVINVHAQENDRIKNIGLGYGWVINPLDLNHSIQMSLTLRRHVFYGGVLLPSSTWQLYKVGGNIGYLFFPERDLHRFDLFFLANFEYQAQTTGYKYFYNNIGFGFYAYIFKGFNFNSSVGLGPGFEGQNPFDFTLISFARIGIGYNFKLGDRSRYLEGN